MPSNQRHRVHPVRAQVVNLRRLPLYVRQAMVAESDEIEETRPTTRGECMGQERPCPWISCRHHLYLDVSKSGNLKINFPDLEPLDLPQTCSLDVADGGGITLDDTGRLMNLTRERVRQIEVLSLRSVKARGGPPLASFVDKTAPSVRLAREQSFERRREQEKSQPIGMPLWLGDKPIRTWLLGRCHGPERTSVKVLLSCATSTQEIESRHRETDYWVELKQRLVLSNQQTIGTAHRYLSGALIGLGLRASQRRKEEAA